MTLGVCGLGHSATLQDTYSESSWGVIITDNLGGEKFYIFTVFKVL